MTEFTAPGGGWSRSAPAAGGAEATKPLVRNPLERSRLRPRELAAVASGFAVLVFAAPSAASFAVGLPLVLVGEALRLWSAGHLWKSRELVVSGPYAHVRHPLYGGTLVLVAGFLAIAGPWVAAVGLPLFALFFFAYYYPYKERREARRLERHFGARFRAYREAVPALLPSLRARVPDALARPQARWCFSRVRDNDEVGTAVAVAAALALLLLRTALS